MDRELVDRWIVALESGEYAQGKGQLVQDTVDGLRYCCLGVACEVAGIRRIDETFEVGPGHRKVFLIDDKLMARLGLSVTVLNELMEMNDAQEKSFPQIAARIKEITHVCG